MKKNYFVPELSELVLSEDVLTDSNDNVQNDPYEDSTYDAAAGEFEMLAED